MFHDTLLFCDFYYTKDHPLLPQLDFGLCARVFSAVLLPLEPTIAFSHSSAVFPSKPRDFRLHAPAIPFYPLVSGFLHHVTSR